MYEQALDFMNAPRRLKRELPIPWVMEQEGFRLELRGSSLVASCPFHQDSDPSFSITDDAERGWRWGCWPCGLSGDVVDLMRALYGIGFTDAVTAGIRGVAKIKETGWKAPILEGTEAFNAPAARQLLSAARAQDQFPLSSAEQVEAFLRAHAARNNSWPIIDAEWLVRTFDLVTLNGRLLVPVYSANRELVGLKHRSLNATDHLFAFPGSQLADVLYGEQWLGGVGPVVLCEGESDVWTANWLLRNSECNVLGLATGAGSLPRPAQRLVGREVHIVFDGDDAGRMGAQRWKDALGSLTDVTVWNMPDGLDLTTYGRLDFLPF